MNFATATKADLQAEVRRLRRALGRSASKNVTLAKSLEQMDRFGIATACNACGGRAGLACYGQ